mgnify:FL=1|tara:strand:+ start:842 stop:1084 length:243 start_codon:yes stop_codon:yes gene_type:complete
MENNRTYTILNISDLANVDFSQVGETSANTVRKSIDETQFVIKYNSTPTFISDGTVTPVEVLTYSEVLELMSTSEWSITE